MWGITQFKREQGIHTHKRRDAIAARRANVDWDNAATGGLTKGDTNETIRRDKEADNLKHFGTPGYNKEGGISRPRRRAGGRHAGMGHGRRTRAAVLGSKARAGFGVDKHPGRPNE